MIKKPRARRWLLLSILTALPIALAWYAAARRSWLPTTYKVGRGTVAQLQFAPDGSSLVTSVWDGGAVLHATTLDAGSLSPQRTLAHYMMSKGSWPFYFSTREKPSGEPFAYDFFTSSQAFEPQMVFSPDFKRVCNLKVSVLPSPPEQNAVFAYDRPEVWDITSRKLLWRASTMEDCKDVQFSPRGTFLAYLKAGHCVLLQARDFRPLKLDGPAWHLNNRLAFSPDERWLVAGDGAGELRVWDTRTGHVARAMRHPVPKRAFDMNGTELYELTFSPDNKFIASSDETKLVCIWDATQGKLLQTLKGLATPPRVLAFASNTSGAPLLASGNAGVVTLWNWRTGAKLRAMTLRAPKGVRQYVTRLAWSPDGSILASGYDDGIVARWRIK